ncbi:uncharacterized protein LOC120285206 [Drosophila simulans]|uniref:uncharacterized protein LOC120285206 n=1 Tax=Drosophila simulans TaxID=7240 RepID=UPI001D110C52|nr:uncharacterized protein LOC120285206 [Drosophila simulans]
MEITKKKCNHILVIVDALPKYAWLYPTRSTGVEKLILVRKIRCRLALIYRALGDEDQYNTHFRLANQTDAALGLNCGACGELLGLRPENLEALPCAHILHARCAYEILRRREKNAPRSCPACNKLISSRTHLCGSVPVESESTNRGGTAASTFNTNSLSVDGLLGINSDILLPSAAFCYVQNPALDTENSALLSPKVIYHSNLSLASLSMRASSLTIDSGQNVTSSV